MTNKFQLTTATSLEELQQILTLQEANHIKALSDHTNGFLTIKHDLEMLIQMSNSIPQIVAKKDGRVVGYALTMLRTFSNMVPLLKPMFEMFLKLTYQGSPVEELKYYVMGQICVAKENRGEGMFEQLYNKHRQLFSNQFDVCLTEVSSRNTRSMRAHEKVGFKNIHTFKDTSEEWNIMLWDWKAS